MEFFISVPYYSYGLYSSRFRSSLGFGVFGSSLSTCIAESLGPSIQYFKQRFMLYWLVLVEVLKIIFDCDVLGVKRRRLFSTLDIKSTEFLNLVKWILDLIRDSLELHKSVQAQFPFGFTGPCFIINKSIDSDLNTHNLLWAYFKASIYIHLK